MMDTMDETGYDGFALPWNEENLELVTVSNRPDSDGEVQRGMKEEERDRGIERACLASIELQIREVGGNEVGRNSEQTCCVHSRKWDQNKVRSE